ncbi:S-formylglutathione hydrolase [Teredinibacter franksiae]|uniref:S-formylglutathione hydrolase n=1 Tax=Teredinibacter franksiae TaxID=2761453 RepID=UPI0016277B25|nr:S-formylglutathione hydrolase [Teredinibacter franksiae]
MLEIARQKCFAGYQLRFQHQSDLLKCGMRFSLYLPPQAETQSVPVLFWLSGLTCTDENFVQKAGAQRYAAEHGIALLAPDTSPRGEDIPDDPQSHWDFGLGAGFYCNATEQPWQQHYQMESYICQELPALLAANFSQLSAHYGIAGHSMGGHGAITLGLKNPQLFKSISAFAPISSPMNCPWGMKALTHYLGADRTSWQKYDATALIGEQICKTPLYVDQGGDDDFLEDQLQPERLREASEQNNHPLTLNIREGYDHSYFTIASFIGEHIAYHRGQLLS